MTRNQNHLDLLNIIGGNLKYAANTNGGEYAGPCPFCGGKDRFRVWPQQDPPSWWCRQCDCSGDAVAFVQKRDNVNFHEACQRLGLHTEYGKHNNGNGKYAAATKRAYTSLADYAQAHGVPAEVFERAGWQETKKNGRPALEFPTRSGPRWRFLDGGDRSYFHDRGFKPGPYGFERAAELSKHTKLPIVLTNGEASVVVAQHYGIPAVTIAGGGERRYPDEIVEQLRHLHDGSFLIALENDGKKPKAATELARQFSAPVLEMGSDMDLADFCKLHGDDSASALRRCKYRSTPDQARDTQADEKPTVQEEVGTRQVNYVDYDALCDTAPPVGSFPVDALPDPARTMVEHVAQSTRTPPDLAALLALAAIATALQGKARVQIHESWTEELCLYVAAVAQPGDGKSPVFAHMLQPIRRRAARLRDDHKQDLKAWDALAQEDKKSLPEPPEHPPRLSTTDTTPEKLAALMEQNNGKMSVLSAEAGIIGTLAGRYTQRGSSANIDLLLQAWNGEFVEIDRKDPNAPSLYLPRPLLTMAITMQPIVLESIRKNKELGARGLWDRFLLCYPAASPLSLGYDQPAVPCATREAWAALLDALFDMSESSEPPNIVIRPDALAHWNAQLRPYERLGDGDYAAIRGVLKKGMSQLPRLAALLLIADNPAARLGSLPVTVEHARRAWAIYEALIPHFLKIAGATVGISTTISNARKLATWIRNNASKWQAEHGAATFIRSHAQKHSPVRDKNDLSAALDHLLEAGWLVLAETKSNNTNARRYVVPVYSPIFATVATVATVEQPGGAIYEPDAANGISGEEQDTATVAATVDTPAATVDQAAADQISNCSTTEANCSSNGSTPDGSDIPHRKAQDTPTVATVATVAEAEENHGGTPPHDVALIAACGPMADDTRRKIADARQNWRSSEAAFSQLCRAIGWDMADAIRAWVEAEKMARAAAQRQNE